MDNNKNIVSPQFVQGLEPLSRRRFLRAAVTTGTVIATGVMTGCANMLGKVPTRAPDHIRNMTKTEHDVIEKMVRILLPVEEEGLPSTVDDVPVMQNLDDMFGRMDDDLRAVLDFGITSFEYSALGLSLKFKQFTKLSDTDALKYVHIWQRGNHVQRGFMTSMKSMITLNYWRDEKTWDALEYDGPVTVKWGIRRLGNAPLPEVS